MWSITVILILVSVSFTCQFKINYDISNIQSRASQISNGYGFSNSTLFNWMDIIPGLYPENVIRHEEIDDTQCGRQYAAFLVGLENREEWALRMLDASSKIPAGLLEGNLKDLGFYDECVSTATEKNTESIRGRHCMYSLGFGNKTILFRPPTLSVCLPAICNEDDVMGILQNFINRISYDYDLDLEVEKVTCSTLEHPWGNADIIALSVLFVYLCFLILCTIYDIISRRSAVDGQLETHWSKFSLYTNAQNILSSKIPQGNISAIQGIRILSVGWVILGHEFFIQTYGVIVNTADAYERSKSWSALYVLIAPFTVDTFFVLSGFLTCYLFMKESEKNRKFNIIKYYLHRYIRLTPALAGLLLLTIYIFPRIGSGPIWDANMNVQRDSCSKNWWAMMLYIHNYVNTEHLMCLAHTWYLAVDMQFFWISPLIIYPLAKKPRIGIIIWSVFMIASIVTTVALTVKNEYSGIISVAQDPAKSAEKQRYFYITSHTRIGPWLLGILTGYKLFLVQNKAPDMRLMIVGWIAAALAFACGSLTYTVFQLDSYKYNVYWEAFYAGFCENIWAIGVCWLIYASVLGYGGAINRFLSLSIFLPLGRISYSIYLFHFMIQLMRTSAIRLPIYFSDSNIFYLFLSDIVLCVFAGFLLSLVFESPFMALEKLIFNRTKKEHANES